MVDQELLQAIGQMMDTKLAEQDKRIDAKIAELDQKTDTKLQAIADRLDALQESVEEVRDSTNYIAEWVERLENSFKAHEITTTR